MTLFRAIRSFGIRDGLRIWWLDVQIRREMASTPVTEALTSTSAGRIDATVTFSDHCGSAAESHAGGPAGAAMNR